MERFYDIIRQAWRFLRQIRVYFGRHPEALPANSLIFFPCRRTLFCCGLAGIVSFNRKREAPDPPEIGELEQTVGNLENACYSICRHRNVPLADHYLCGPDLIPDLLEKVRTLKTDRSFFQIFGSRQARERLEGLSGRIRGLMDREASFLSENMGYLAASEVELMAARLEGLKDVAWCLKAEISGNIERVEALMACPPAAGAVTVFKKINAVLNSIDRLEVRGRDSAGISLMFFFEKENFDRFLASLSADGRLEGDFRNRLNRPVLLNRSISMRSPEDDGGRVCLAVTYKVAAEIGSLGDNVGFLRREIAGDAVLQSLALCPHTGFTVCAHTRWASVGAITEPNCHPVDGIVLGSENTEGGIIHVCLNGDIDNFMELRERLEATGCRIHHDITTDTKIIPLQVESYLKKGHPLEEAFRLAVNDFKGSHAISMHSDLAPGKIFLAQRGSGQAVFVGLGRDHYMHASEVYGFVEETSAFLKINGEQIFEGKHGRTQGQIFVLDQESGGGLEGIRACHYDGAPIALSPEDIRYTGITSRDIDRQGFPHYFLKEIGEAPLSVERTLLNRWKIIEGHHAVVLDEKTVPAALKAALSDGRIRRIYFVGQGTAGVAARACSDILKHYMGDPSLQVSALKASELSGFTLSDEDDNRAMADALVVAITQSGTTTDTNRTVDMVRERGAFTMAIVNRRDSDITFKVDGVMYTSSGRDIEMSVASTKAFYSQIIAGALLGLYIARLKGRRNDTFVAEEIQRLLSIPGQMRKVLSMGDAIEASARRLAPSRTHWAAVGSGPNKASADEIRIKLSELCYKTISSDYIEDKKHIDLSSEPLIIVCAAGARESVIGDIIKDTAIFKAHKAAPVVIADEGETRFRPYAEDLFQVPRTGQHLAPILNTLVGHLWGYYAALSIHEGSRFLNEFREDVHQSLTRYAEQGLDVYEVILEKSFREKIANFYSEFRKRKTENRLPGVMGLVAASDLTLLLKYLSGRLPVSDFELDFGKKGTASNMLDALFVSLGEAINAMARPVDAIKHQAKTVTVGTSRISEKFEGILFDALAGNHFKVSQLTPSNVIVLKNIQGILSGINGFILYRVGGLNLLGEPTEETVIEVVKKEGMLRHLTSRVETDTTLKGTKRTIVRQGNIYIGKGRKDDRSILIVPVMSSAPQAAGIIEYLLLLNISFRENVPLPVRIKALGGKYENIKNIVQENSVPWKDGHLERIPIDELFGRSAEKIAELIVSGF